MPIPSKLRPILAAVCRDPKNRGSVQDFNNGVIEWNDARLVEVKKEIREALRVHQDERCFFCRRPIIAERRNMYEDIEHYLDKSKPCYRRWGIHPYNLTLSCKACNFEKGTKDLGDGIVKGAFRHPPRNGGYSWVHPYYDSYDDNIQIQKGPIYSVSATALRPMQARALISDLKLDKLKELERRKYDTLEKIKRINNIVSALIISGKRKQLQLRLLRYQRACIDDGFI